MMPLGTYGHVLILGVIIGLMGVVYNTCLSKSQDLYQKVPGQTMRLLIPFMLAGVFGFLYPSILGGGHSLVEVLSSGEMVMGSLCLLFVLKFVFSMVSFGSGAPGGIFLPLLVMGADRRHLLQRGGNGERFFRRAFRQLHHPGDGRLLLRHCPRADYGNYLNQ